MGQNLNAICPYFTMFPLEFPYSILSKKSEQGLFVLDPFCGRGTTNFAARLLSMPCLGIDSNPVAIAISQAKMVDVTPAEILSELENIMFASKEPKEIPSDEFWALAFHTDVLKEICRIREVLLTSSDSPARIALRAIMIGALHGPMNKGSRSYFSNQAPRTYAPKPRYAANYWRSKGILPERVDIFNIIKVRAERYFGNRIPSVLSAFVLGDSRNNQSYIKLDAILKKAGQKVSWIVTSPPYYGMRTYYADQWLRNWFLGGPDKVDYFGAEQLEHSSPIVFTENLRQVWRNSATLCADDAFMAVRFGGINDRKVDYEAIVVNSFKDTPWEVFSIRDAGVPPRGRRQADTFSIVTKPLREIDVFVSRCEVK